MEEQLTAEQEDWLLKNITTTFRFHFRKIMLGARKENQLIEIPVEVVNLRELNDCIHKIENQTQAIPKIARVFRNMFAKATGDFDEHVLKK